MSAPSARKKTGQQQNRSVGLTLSPARSRSQNPVALEDIQSAVCNQVDKVKKEDGIEVDIEMIGQRAAAKATISKEMEKLVLGIWSDCGVEPKEVVRSTNINLPLGSSWPAVCLGLCRGDNIHREDEYVEIDGRCGLPFEGEIHYASGYVACFAGRAPARIDIDGDDCCSRRCRCNDPCEVCVWKTGSRGLLIVRVVDEKLFCCDCIVAEAATSVPYGGVCLSIDD